MKYLTFIRHAKSSWTEHGLSDHDRPLNPRGQRDAPRMAEWLSQSIQAPELIICSTALRAQQTADAFQTALKIEHNKFIDEPRLYMAGMQEWIEVLQDSLARPEPMAFVSHNPGITQIINWLCDEDILNVPTCGIAIVAIPEDLQRFDSGLGTLLEYQTPKTLR
jgi:phosphohistidine phosphatase